MKTLRTSPDAPYFDEAAGLTYEDAPTYDEAAAPDYDLIDPDYDEGQQREFADDFTEPDYKDAGQEYRLRKQK
jgi:hypothetical protein